MSEPARDRERFEVDLTELEKCARVALPEMERVLQDMARRWPHHMPASRFGGLLNAVNGIEDSQVKAATTMGEAARRLQQLAVLYREADRRAAESIDR